VECGEKNPVEYIGLCGDIGEIIYAQKLIVEIEKWASWAYN